MILVIVSMSRGGWVTSLLFVWLVVRCPCLALSHRLWLLGHRSGVLRVRSRVSHHLSLLTSLREKSIVSLLTRSMNLGWPLSYIHLLLLLLLLLREIFLSFSCLRLISWILFVLLLKHNHVSIEFLVRVSFALLLHLVIDNCSMLCSVVSTLVSLILPWLLLLLLLLLLSVINFLRVFSLLRVQVYLFCLRVDLIICDKLSNDLSDILFVG